MSCDFHKGSCSCWQVENPAFPPFVCGCPGRAHSPGCRYYAVQEAARISEKAAKAEQALVQERWPEQVDKEVPFQGTAGLEFPAPLPFGLLRAAESLEKTYKDAAKPATMRTHSEAARFLADRLLIPPNERAAFILGYVLGKS